LCKKHADVGVKMFVARISDGSIGKGVPVTLHLSKALLMQIADIFMNYW
jgi:hypothetical protein